MILKEKLFYFDIKVYCVIIEIRYYYIFKGYKNKWENLDLDIFCERKRIFLINWVRYF